MKYLIILSISWRHVSTEYFVDMVYIIISDFHSCIIHINANNHSFKQMDTTACPKGWGRNRRITIFTWWSCGRLPTQLFYAGVFTSRQVIISTLDRACTVGSETWERYGLWRMNVVLLTNCWMDHLCSFAHKEYLNERKLIFKWNITAMKWIK